MATQHDRIDEIFCQAAEMATNEERFSFLEQACGDDPKLRARIERLLAAQSKVDSLKSNLAGP